MGSPQPQIRRVRRVPELCPFLSRPLGGCSVTPQPGKGMGPVLSAARAARDPRSCGGTEPGPGSASPELRLGRGSHPLRPPSTWSCFLGLSILPSIPASLPASLPPSPLHPGGPTGPSSHAPNSGPCSLLGWKGEPEFSSMSLPPRLSLQRCPFSIPCSHRSFPARARGHLGGQFWVFFFGGMMRAGGTLGASLMFQLTQMLGQHRGCGSSFRHRFWGFFFGEVRIDLVYIIFSPSCWEGIAHSRGFSIKKSGCLPPLPLRSGANWCPADVGVGTPGDAPRQRLRMSRGEVGKLREGEVSARGSSSSILTRISEGDPSRGRIVLVPSWPPEGQRRWGGFGGSVCVPCRSRGCARLEQHCSIPPAAAAVTGTFSFHI